MSQTAGTFLVVEGTDGSGKATQVGLLAERLKGAGYDVEVFDFPRYDKASSHFIKAYLNGEYGSAEVVGPYTASVFFALDRYEAARHIRKALDEGKIVLANRFTASNMGHQGSKFVNKEERLGFFIWLDNLEYQMLGIPRPNANLVLFVDPEIGQQLVDKKTERSYTDKKRDILEADIEHLRAAHQTYQDMCSLFPKDFRSIDCSPGSKLLSIEEISELVWKEVQAMLPKKDRLKTDTGKPLLKKSAEGRFSMTAAGRDYLEDIVTSTTNNIYAFTEAISPATVAAAMARLSRRGDDMRITLLDEFVDKAGKDEALLKRVITAYGDDSVQQLAGVHAVVEGASNILTKKLEWGRLGAYLEQSTRYIYLDQKDDAGNYRYYKPSNLAPELLKSYCRTMDSIFDTYSSMVHTLTDYVAEHSTVPEAERDIAWKGAIRAQACDAIRPVLPVATKLTVGIFGSAQMMESLIMHLMSDELLEARETGQKLLDECRKVIPVFLERADKPDRGGAMVAYRANTARSVRELARKYLPETHSAEVPPVQLTSYWPLNELDLVADMLYEHSSLSLDAIKKAVMDWPYDKKLQAFEAYIGERLNRRHKPGRAIEKAHYSFDLVCDYGIFRDLQRHRMVDGLEWQQLTPRYGYEIPALVEEAGLTDDFERCFELSLELYSELQQAGHELEAQYATLLGHKMRWKITYNAREAFHLHELRTSPQGHPGYRKLVLAMHEKLSEVHPLMAEAMHFINKGEDPELTRLAAERYTQLKLSQIK